MNTEAKEAIKSQLKKFFGTSSLATVRKALLASAILEYGTKSSRIDIGGGIAVGYTDNSNHFCKFFFILKGCGSSNYLALSKKDLNKCAYNRGCADYYIFSEKETV